METTSSSQSIFNLKIDSTARQHLLVMASWAMIIFITALIKYVFSIIEYINLKNQLDYHAGGVYMSSRGSTLFGVIFTIIIGLLINYFLFQFSSLTKKGINNLSQADLNRGLSNLKAFFNIIGVLMIIFLAFAALGIIFSGFSKTS